MSMPQLVRLCLLAVVSLGGILVSMLVAVDHHTKQFDNNLCLYFTGVMLVASGFS